MRADPLVIVAGILGEGVYEKTNSGLLCAVFVMRFPIDDSPDTWKSAIPRFSRSGNLKSIDRFLLKKGARRELFSCLNLCLLACYSIRRSKRGLDTIVIMDGVHPVSQTSESRAKNFWWKGIRL